MDFFALISEGFEMPAGAGDWELSRMTSLFGLGCVLLLFGPRFSSTILTDFYVESSWAWAGADSPAESLSLKVRILLFDYSGDWSMTV